VADEKTEGQNEEVTPDVGPPAPGEGDDLENPELDMDC
jgi:hypothetical protein